MISIVNKEDCCGCGACYNICPKNSIEMKSDEEGFLYPNINLDTCINCGICEKVCPIINIEDETINQSQRGMIIASKRIDVLKQSTSGGAFTAIAKYILKQGGYVYGVEMTSEFNVHHIEIENVNDIEKFRNSKYVQSDTELVYKRVEQRLKSGEQVCFSGTPCQIEGLRHYLGKEYENLLLVDVVCRAVPSPGVWRKYINYLQKKNGKIQEVRFRDKGLGYQFSTMKIQMKDGRTIRNGIESDPWLRMFFSGMIIRPSCTQCKFRRRYRKSDITIWDCFNVSDISSKFDEKSGATRMLIHSPKGERVFDSIKGEYIFEEINPATLVSGLTELSKSPKAHPKKEIFFNDFQNLEMNELINKYFPNSFNVKIKKQMRLFLNRIGMDIWVKKAKRMLKL